MASGRLEGKTAIITGTAVYLASEDSRLMTGQTLAVDAGAWFNG